MYQQIEIYVNVHCEKCRTEVLKSVTNLSGIDKISLDLEKQTLVVVGDVDPVSVVKRVMKIGKIAKMVYVGSPKNQDPASSSTSEGIKIEYPSPVWPDVYCPNVCPVCPNVSPAVVVEYSHPCETGGCVIL
ncbi:heavy metal-associated isoprenylated plant protein 2-like [Bidens hawaiensis]|uniref:heavy metal-associated isoprenylated plant protein 2-like n=1 Tax=Bidens hawaiensis TaxID=980011 RepID=UPI0040492351